MARSRIGRFAHDEDGAVIAFIIILFLVMVVAAGMAIDFMRHETARADLQNALDRGVLAATNVNQTAIAEIDNGDGSLDDEYTALVSSYMRSRSFHEVDPEVVATGPTPGSNDRSVTARASYTFDTFFLKIAGFNTMKVVAASAAEHSEVDVEISLVLDVSGSMGEWVDVDEDGSTFIDYDGDGRWDNGEPSDPDDKTRMQLLKEAASLFIDSVLREDDPSSPNYDPNYAKVNDRTFVSIIPYHAEVNVGAGLAQRFSGYWDNREHSYSNCFWFKEADFDRLDITTTQTIDQVQHFREPNTNRFLCRNSNPILPYGNSPGALRTYIDSMSPQGWTATYHGIKWGLALLDPGARPIVSGLISDGVVESSFEGWPHDWRTPGVRKVLIILSDGRNTNLYRMPEPHYTTAGGADYWKDVTGYRTRDGSDTTWNHAELEIENAAEANSDPLRFGDGDKRMHRLCNQIIGNPASSDDDLGMIFTIGVEMGGTSQEDQDARNALSACATDPLNHFLVGAADMGLAFEAIAATVLELRLKTMN